MITGNASLIVAAIICIASLFASLPSQGVTEIR